MYLAYALFQHCVKKMLCHPHFSARFLYMYLAYARYLQLYAHMGPFAIKTMILGGVQVSQELIWGVVLEKCGVLSITPNLVQKTL